MHESIHVCQQTHMNLYICMDGYRETCIYVSVSIYVYNVCVCMCACIQIHTGMHAYRMHFLANKEYVSDHRCERTNMTTK